MSLMMDFCHITLVWSVSCRRRASRQTHCCHFDSRGSEPVWRQRQPENTFRDVKQSERLQVLWRETCGITFRVWLVKSKGQRWHHKDLITWLMTWSPSQPPSLSLNSDEGSLDEDHFFLMFCWCFVAPTLSLRVFPLQLIGRVLLDLWVSRRFTLATLAR